MIQSIYVPVPNTHVGGAIRACQGGRTTHPSLNPDRSILLKGKCFSPAADWAKRQRNAEPVAFGGVELQVRRSRCGKAEEKAGAISEEHESSNCRY